MNRRSFLLGILATGMAPAIVRAESIMRIKPPELPREFPRAIWDASRGLLLPVWATPENLELFGLRETAVIHGAFGSTVCLAEAAP